MKESLEKTVYVIDTPREIFWSKRKMDTQYKHVEFLYRDRARYKEMSEGQFRRLKENTKKKVWEIVA